MGKRVRLTMSQALVRAMAAQMTEIDGKKQPIFGGVWAIFGHGNVAALGEALYQAKETLPTFRAHNEQAMAHAAIGFAKSCFRRRFMACTSSIGPGATNMVTAAALAHVNRLPVLLLPGDVFAGRVPDPVLQQIEDFGDGTVSVNDCFRPVSRYFDRISRPEQIIPAFQRAMQVLTDPAECGPVTLSLCQDVQAEAYDFPESFLEERIWSLRRVRPDRTELESAVAAIRNARQPLIITGGGTIYSGASDILADFCNRTGIPACETQGGKSSLPDAHPLNMGAVGVTGTSAANRLAEQADVIIAVGTRLQDFTTGSWALFRNEGKTIIGLNIQPFDAGKHRARPLVADAFEGLRELGTALQDWTAPKVWTADAKDGKSKWQQAAAKVTAATNAALPSDAQVIGAVQRAIGPDAILVNASGGLPGELHKLWKAGGAGSYHGEYGFSTMGYEIAGGLGCKMARPEKEVVVMVGDGSYLMLNSEIATSVMLGLKLTIVLLDNRGFGCINRLQMATGGAPFNNLFKDARQETLAEVDFVGHAASLGAVAEKAVSIADLEAVLIRSKQNNRTTVIVIDTDPQISTGEGGAWWDVAVPQISERHEVANARKAYEDATMLQRVGD